MPGKKHDKVGLLDNKKTVNDNMVISDSRASDHHKHPPLVSALKASAEQNVASFHFPGHNRGRAAPSSLTRLIGTQPFIHDLPELPELDNLFAPEGPILDAQKEAAKLFGATETWFLVGGTTCGIQASVMATCSPGDTLILPRNSHISAFNSMVLSGVIPKYITPEYDFDWDIACGITPSQASKTFLFFSFCPYVYAYEESSHVMAGGEDNQGVGDRRSKSISSSHHFSNLSWHLQQSRRDFLIMSFSRHPLHC